MLLRFLLIVAFLAAAFNALRRAIRPGVSSGPAPGAQGRPRPSSRKPVDRGAIQDAEFRDVDG